MLGADGVGVGLGVLGGADGAGVDVGCAGVRVGTFGGFGFAILFLLLLLPSFMLAS